MNIDNDLSSDMSSDFEGWLDLMSRIIRTSAAAFNTTPAQILEDQQDRLAKDASRFGEHVVTALAARLERDKDLALDDTEVETCRFYREAVRALLDDAMGAP